MTSLQAELVEQHRRRRRAAEWDALDPTGHPFCAHAFLEALESTGCVGGDAGWMPQHLRVA